MTVSELRKAMQDVPDDVPVKLLLTLPNGSGHYLSNVANISTLNNNGCEALTLVPRLTRCCSFAPRLAPGTGPFIHSAEPEDCEQAARGWPWNWKRTRWTCSAPLGAYRPCSWLTWLIRKNRHGEQPVCAQKPSRPAGGAAAPGE